MVHVTKALQELVLSIPHNRAAAAAAAAAAANQKPTIYAARYSSRLMQKRRALPSSLAVVE
jgi:hypothetical protein